MSRSICFICLKGYGYFAPEVQFQGGGAERQIHLLSRGLASEYDLHAVVGDFGQPLEEERHGVTLHRAYPIQDRQNVFQPIRHLIQLRAAMKRADADVYVHRGYPRIAGFVYLLARSLGAKFVFNVANDTNVTEDADDLAFPVDRLYRRAIRDADALVTQTDYQRRQVHSAYGIDPHVVPNGYPSAADPLPFSERSGFLWVGRFDREQKRPHRLLDVAAELPDHTFKIAGPADEGTYASRVLDRARSLENVEYLGLVPPEEVHEHYRRALAVVNTSAYEGFPNTYLEAWRQGTPVASLEVDPERYLDTGSDSVAATADLDSLGDRCQRLATDETFWSQASTLSYETFESRYTIEEVVDRYARAVMAAFDE